MVRRARKTRPRLPLVEHGLEGPDRGLPTPVLVDEEGHARLVARAHHALGGREVVRHRLLADDRLAVGDRELDEAGVGRGVGDDVEEVDVLPAQQLLRVVVDGADAQLPPEGLGLRARAVVEGHAPGPRQLAPGAQLVPRPEPGSEKGEAERPRRRGQVDVSGSGATLSATPGGCPWSARPVQARSPRGLSFPSKGRPQARPRRRLPPDEPGGPSMHRFALALVLAMSAAGPTAASDAAKAPAPEDRYLWLEDVTGEKALDWARARNAESAKVLETGDFAALEKRILDILDSDARIPYVEKLGPWYYNFWRDAKNPRGLWRRTTLAEYRKEHPAWETVIDLDALGAAEKENWVWHGADCLKPEYKRCLVSLSRGGADADVVREFDLEAKAFLKDGFFLPESKNAVGWRDADTLYVGTDFGPGLDDHLRLPADREGLEAGHPARLGGDGLRGPGGGRLGRRLPRPHEGLRAGLRLPRGDLLLERDVPASRRQAPEDREARQRERQRPPGPAAARAARRLDGRREDLARGRPPRRGLRGLPEGRAALRRAVRADGPQVPRRLQPDLEPRAAQRARQRPQPRLRPDPQGRGLDARAASRDARVRHGERERGGRRGVRRLLPDRRPTT